MVPVSLHAQLDSLESDQDVKDVNHHVLNAQVHQLSVLTVWTLSSSDQALENANKVHHATTVKLTSAENAPESVMPDFTTKMEPVSLEDAQADSRTTDSEDVSAHQFQLEDANNQPSDLTVSALTIVEATSSPTPTPEHVMPVQPAVNHALTTTLV